MPHVFMHFPFIYTDCLIAETKFGKREKMNLNPQGKGNWNEKGKKEREDGELANIYCLAKIPCPFWKSIGNRFTQVITEGITRDLLRSNSFQRTLIDTSSTSKFCTCLNSAWLKKLYFLLVDIYLTDIGPIMVFTGGILYPIYVTIFKQWDIIKLKARIYVSGNLGFYMIDDSRWGLTGEVKQYTTIDLSNA